MSVDVETYSSVDLAKAGVYRYTESPDFALLLIAYAVNGRAVEVLDMTAGDDDTAFRDLLFDPEIIKVAYNANFERTTLAKYYGRPMPPEEWRDTMIEAHSCGLPGTLATVGISLGLPQDKQKDMVGKRLIAYFCKPCAPTKTNGGRTRNLPGHDPEKWELFKEYNRQDVVAEMAIAKALDKMAAKTMPPQEWQLWTVDQRINDTGINLDMDMVDKIVDYDKARTEELMQEAKKLTGLDNPNSLIQLKEWLARRGIPMKQVTKETVTEILKQDLPEDVRRVLEIRLATGKSSVAKYSAMQDAVCADGRLRGSLQFYGAARTGRWSGRLVQVQNLARNSLEDLDLARQLVKRGDFDTLDTLFGEPAFVFSELVRTALIPSPGCRFIVSDFSAIEARVIAWLAGQQNTLEAFAAGKDIYCETASMMYGVPVIKHGVNGELRARGKVAVLACGYGGGVEAMKRMDTRHVIPEEELQEAVDKWRAANPQIVHYWSLLERSAIRTLNGGKTAPIIPKYKDEERARYNEEITGAGLRSYSDWFNAEAGAGVQFYLNKRGLASDLCVRLPSGRSIVYADARLETNENGKAEITYMGAEQSEGISTVAHTWGGKIAENITQAVARDCLGYVMQKVDAMGYHIVSHVHDEIIVDVPKEDTEAPQKILDVMHFYPGHCPGWAKGLPLKGDMHECDYYKKD
jgi:DNA polymerase